VAKDSAAKGADLDFLVDFEPGRDLFELNWSNWSRSRGSLFAPTSSP